MTLTCAICGESFERPGTRGPVPQFCSIRCKSRRDRSRPGRREYEREYHRREWAAGKRAEYARAYNRRPEVMARQRQRMREKWHTDPEYRARQLARWDPHAGVIPPAPYTGHRWLQMAHDVVVKDLDPTSQRAELYWDDMGEALLALLEGRDMREAVTAYRRQEYVSRYLTLHLGDWGDDEDEQNRWFESVMPTVPSAEDEFFAREAETALYLKTPYHHGKNGHPMRVKHQQPSRRRAKDGRSWKKHAT